MTGSIFVPPILVTTGDMQAKFNAASPRHKRMRTPAASLLIHGGILVLWLGLLLRAWFPGLLGWSAGMVYVTYDTFLLGFTAWQTFRLTRGPKVTAPAAAVTLGVIVAAHNEAAVLPITLAGLMRQTVPPDAILIADDGSVDATESALAPYGLVPPAIGGLAVSALHPSLSWLRLAQAGKAAALNAAIPRLDTSIVLTVDADTLLEPGAIAAMRAAFATDPALVAATGVLTPVCAATPAGRLFQWFQTYEYIRNFLSRFAWMQADGLLLISGAFAGFRRDAVLAVGGFDPDCLVEDYELIHRLRRYAAANRLTWRTAVLGNARALTEAPSSAGAFLRQRRRWFGGFLQTQFWYRDMVGNPDYGRLGTWMLPVKAADTLQPIYGLTAFALLIAYIVTGRLGVLLPVTGIILGKIAIDLGFHLWSVHLYRRWTGDRTSNAFGYAFVAAVIEPFSFQLLRHVGAALGWVMFLGRQRGWGVQVRVAGAWAGGGGRGHRSKRFFCEKRTKKLLNLGGYGIGKARVLR
jgi:cellulose synthase/poly-beta-1,6-N-acetylglucosamine synthase-like glycosyltransferase